MRIPHPARIAAAVAGIAFAALTAATVAAAPAAATGDHRPECVTIKHGDTTPFVNRNAADTANTNGVFKLTENGVKIVTPDNDAKVYGYLPLSPAVKLGDIQAAGFKNINGEGLAPSYQFGLSVGGAWGGTLAWEQIYQPDAYKGTGDVLHDGKSKWYITKDHPGYTKHTVKTWDELVALLPKDTTATYYGLNQGAGGIATNTVDELKLATKTWCKTNVWDTKYTSPSPSVSVSVSASPSPSKSTSSSASASPSASTSATPGLPLTGANPTGLVAVGVGLVGAGIGVLLFLRRRRARIQFTA